MMWTKTSLLTCLCTAVWTLGLSMAATAGLEDELGRSEVRVLSAAVPVPVGQKVVDSGYLDRLEARGYARVKRRPSKPGEYFFGSEILWVYRRAYRGGGRERKARLFGVLLRSDGRMVSLVDGDRKPLREKHGRLEPMVLSESLEADRAPRIPLDVESLPDHVWRCLLAAEDHRFFEHKGLDGIAIARALLKNVKKGKVSEGGSTITQQLIKNRDLTPKRTFRRKASEAVRALLLEAEFTKEEILQAYLNSVYMGHREGLAVHGWGAASRAYFSKRPERLTLSESAALAAIIQAPNRLHPERHPNELKKRRNWVLSRMEELGWASKEEVRKSKRSALRVRPSDLPEPTAPRFVAWAAAVARGDQERRIEKGKGIVVETALDSRLQKAAEEVVREGLKKLRKKHRSLRKAPLQAALVALDVETGDVLAYVPGDPGRPDDFDRARKAERQPGSSIKPLLLLEAFQACGSEGALHPATRVADEPLTLTLPTGDWTPDNADRRFHGTVEIRDAVVRSLNIPFVRICRHCGFDDTADRLRKAGMNFPDEVPPSFTLGSVETSPLDLARAYTVLATPGKAARPRPVLRLETAKGRRLHKFRVNQDRVTGKAAAYLVRFLLQEAAKRGTAAGASIEGMAVAAKTGTSSDRRDAWLAGTAGSVVTVVWVGCDDARPMPVGGSKGAAPIWRAFMEKAAPSRPAYEPHRPESIVEYHVNTETGLRVRSGKKDSRPCLFRRSVRPPKDHFLWPDDPAPVLR